MTQDVRANFAKKAAKGAVTTETDVLPRWNFENFYPEVDSDEFKADFKKLESMIGGFIKKYKGKVSSLTAGKLAKAVEEYKAIEALEGKLGTYVQLKSVQDSVKYGPAEVEFDNKYSSLASGMEFFRFDIKQIPDSDYTKLLKKSKKLGHYEPWLENVRRAIPHTPALNVVEYSTELSPTRDWTKLYDDICVATKYRFEDKDLSEGEISEIFSSDPDQKRRAAAFKVFQDVMTEKAPIFASIHNSIIRLKSVDDRWENFANPADGRHFSNNVDPAVVDALETAVKNSYARVPHRFYALKAKLMGQEHLNIYDRNVNIFEEEGDNYIPYDEAKRIVLDAYREFSPTLAEGVERFFDEGWIDAPLDENKQGGAFAHPGGAYLANPMVMLNYQGKMVDVATMAHELGHGVHQLLAAHEGDALVETPLTLAETASVFGEMLTFKSLLSRVDNDEDRKKLLFEKVNDMLNTVYRQISFYDFEKRTHGAYVEKGRPLTAEEFGEHWIGALQDSYGDAIPLEKEYGPVFGYIPHLVHTPFYVYAYAFGDALVNALYRVYEEGNVPDFEEKYIEMLKAGGTLKPEDLKDKFGLDITDPSFWNKGLQVIEELIDELETLCNDPASEQKLANDNKPGPAPT